MERLYHRPPEFGSLAPMPDSLIPTFNNLEMMPDSLVPTSDSLVQISNSRVSISNSLVQIRGILIADTTPAYTQGQRHCNDRSAGKRGMIMYCCPAGA